VDLSSLVAERWPRPAGQVTQDAPEVVVAEPLDGGGKLERVARIVRDDSMCFVQAAEPLLAGEKRVVRVLGWAEYRPKERRGEPDVCSSVWSELAQLSLEPGRRLGLHHECVRLGRVDATGEGYRGKAVKLLHWRERAVLVGGSPLVDDASGRSLPVVAYAFTDELRPVARALAQGGQSPGRIDLIAPGTVVSLGVHEASG